MITKKNSSSLTVHVAQMTATEDVSRNEQQIFQLLEQVKSPGLVVFPENALFLQIDPLERGSQPPDFSLREPFFKKLQSFCKQKSSTIILGSVPFSGGAERLWNTMVKVTADEAKPVYQKIHLFDVEVKGEKSLKESDTYAYGEAPRMEEIEGWLWGLSICYDLRFSELYAYYRAQGAQALLVPAAFLKTTGQAHWHTLLRARAIENQCFVVAPAQAGQHVSSKTGRVRESFGHSLVIDPWGEILAEAQSLGPELFSVTLDSQRISEVRQQIPMEEHRQKRLWKPPC
ncbi:MAG: carbon-nitrogen hydrolase family protein [Bdellovibrio sp.]|nr:MAG: carbon-nitrogen hydrolase family protein [Bdellovibrio sp.]